MFSNSDDPAYLTALVVTLPRLFLILNHSHVILGALSGFSTVKRRLEGVLQAASLGGAPDLRARIDGSGKSSLLALLKRELGAEACLLPAGHDLWFDKIAGSTGERVRQQMQVLAQGNHSCLLLDEWDANLDKANTTSVSKLLDELAETMTIVEVRHH